MQFVTPDPITTRHAPGAYPDDSRWYVHGSLTTHKAWCFLALLAATLLVFAGCGGTTIIPSQQRLRDISAGHLVNVVGTALHLVEARRTIRVARSYTTTSHTTSRVGSFDERDFVVNGYIIDGRADTRVYEVVAENLLPGQSTLAPGGHWTLNILTQALYCDPRLGQPQGDQLIMTGSVYPTLAPGEHLSAAHTPAGPRIFLVVSIGVPASVPFYTTPRINC